MSGDGFGGFAEAVVKCPNPTEKELEDAEQAVLLSMTENRDSAEDPYPLFATALLFHRKGARDEALGYLEKAINEERRRASAPYRFDFVRLLKYEKLRQTWISDTLSAAAPPSA